MQDVTLKQFWIDINVNIHNKSKSDYEKNNDKSIFNKIEKRKTVKGFACKGNRYKHEKLNNCGGKSR